jgi:hypothetical protein
MMREVIDTLRASGLIFVKLFGGPWAEAVQDSAAGKALRKSALSQDRYLQNWITHDAARCMAAYKEIRYKTEIPFAW